MAAAEAVSAFRLREFTTAPMRFTKQLLMKATFPPVRPTCDTGEMLRRRSGLPGLFAAACECGACRLAAASAPAHVTVCHCAACRAQTPEGRAPYFVAVRRSQAFLLSGQSHFRLAPSSFFALRGVCTSCQTLVAMDYERLEPSTVWLANPTWYRAIDANGREASSCLHEDPINPDAHLGSATDSGERMAEVLRPWTGAGGSWQAYHPERAFHRGKADCDICWSSRLEEDPRFGKAEPPSPRGVARCEQWPIPWKHFVVDSAKFAEACATSETCSA